jgi:ribosomal protein S20
MRQGKTHTALNRTHRSKLRSAIKKVRSSAGDEAKAAYVDASSSSTGPAASG